MTEYFASRMSTPETFAFASGEVSCYSNVSPIKNSPNEDSIALFELGPERAVLAVADGVGGLAGGDVASRTALQTIGKSLKRARDPGEPLRGAILDGIERANEAVLSLKSGATTLALVELCNQTVRPYHAGDSSILVTGQRSRIKLQTIPHSPVGYAVEAGLIDEWEAMVHEERHIITNCVGSTSMRIEIGPELVLAKRDTLVISSDGLGDNLHPAEVVELVRKGRLAACAQRLAATCRQRMQSASPNRPSKPDDLAFLLFRT